jgi:hypothetical protein
MEKCNVQQNPAQDLLVYMPLQLAILSEALVAHRTFSKISEKMCNKTLTQIDLEFTELSISRFSPKLFVAYRTLLKISE